MQEERFEPGQVQELVLGSERQHLVCHFRLGGQPREFRDREERAKPGDRNGEIGGVIHQSSTVKTVAECGRHADLVLALVVAHVLVEEEEEEPGGAEIIAGRRTRRVVTATPLRQASLRVALSGVWQDGLDETIPLTHSALVVASLDHAEGVCTIPGEPGAHTVVAIHAHPLDGLSSLGYCIRVKAYAATFMTSCQ